jgi:ABC-type oligopeptide transport system ATPase subunit
MSIAIVQLSDLHIMDSHNEVLSRATKVVSAVRSCVPSADIALLLYSGDLAFSGKEEQYELADSFCSEVKALFESECAATAEVFVSGNHDVDFGTVPDELRDIANTRAKTDVDSVSPSGTVARRLLEQQAAFYNFVARRLGCVTLSPEQQLFRKQRVQYGTTTIDLNLVNTAFSSTLNERPGSLVFPTQIIPDDVAADADLIISVLHHPLHWLEPSNARRLKRFVESGCDLIFTGHEHLPDAFIKVRTKDDQSCYVEGSALYDPPTRSAFNVVEVDLLSKSVHVYTCCWTNDLYVPGPAREFPLIRHFAVGSKFHNTPDYSDYLEDPGTFYTHPHKKDLRLTDFFVSPTLKRNTKGAPTFVESADCLKFLREERHITILGEEGSGKTALAKTLYRSYLSETSDVPLLINGSNFEGVGDKNVRSLIRKTVEVQYGGSRSEHYSQLPKSSKILIIDDWHKVRFNDRGRARLMRQLKELFGGIVCFASDMLSVQTITTTGDSETVFADFEQCSLSEFGVRLRGQLAEKWHATGREFTAEEDDLSYEVKQSENRINSILEKNFLPSFPFVVLTLLQADSTQVGSATLGSYGHLYEVLITRRLGESSDKATDLGMKYTYISRMAYCLFSNDKRRISAAEMTAINNSYCADYGQTVDLQKMLRELQQAQIISWDGDEIRFKYRACYCYFVAKFFQENLPSDEDNLRQQILYIADRVYFEDYANIIIFVVFLTKDPLVIKRIIANAGMIYADLAPCNFTTHVEFINSLLKETPKKLIDAIDVRKNRDDFRRQQDEANDDDGDEEHLERSDSKIEYGSAISDSQKVSIAFTNLRIVGHILRNFTGVLKKEPKKQLAHAGYCLTLRVMKRFLDMVRENLDQFRLQMAEVIKVRQALEARDEYDLVSDDELKRRADEELITLVRAIGFLIIKRLSMNLGSEDLAITYEEIKKYWGKDDAAVRLIDLAVKLDHFKGAPGTEIEDLATLFRKNPYSFTLLQDLVAEYLYLNVSDQIRQQKIASLVDISISGQPGFLLHKRKALPSRGTGDRS